MKRTAFEKEQIDGVPRWARANIKTQENADGAVHGRVARQRLSLLKPNTIYCRERYQNEQEPCLPTIRLIIHTRLSVAFSIFARFIGINSICKETRTLTKLGGFSE